MIHPKLFRYGWLGYTFTKILAFLLLYYAILISVSLITPEQKDCQFDEINSTFSKSTDYEEFCFLLDKESAFCLGTVKNWENDHKNMVKVLGFLLGFYTATVMSRWWSQITHMPMITDVTMVLNGIVKCTVKSAVKY